MALAAIRLLKYAIDQNGRWWRLILIVLALAAAVAGLLWVLGADGQLGHHAAAAWYSAPCDAPTYIENRMMQASALL